MLPDITNKVVDGAMGVAGPDATGNFAAVGVAAQGFGRGVLAFADPAQVESALGDGPLRDLLASALTVSAATVYAVPLEGSVPGAVSAVSPGAGNSGAGTVSVLGSPRNEYDVEVEVVSGGVLNEATFRCTVDGLAGRETTMPGGDGRWELPGTGLTLLFDPGAGQFAAGDTHSFSTTAPSATAGEVLAAVDQLLEAKSAAEWVAVAGETAAPLWAALAAKMEAAALEHQYMFAVCQARGPAAGEAAGQWAAALAGAERGSVASTRLQVCAGWIEEADASGQVDARGMIGAYCGALAARGVQEGPDAVRFGAVPSAAGLLPEGLNDGHVELLKNAGYVTARKFAGLKGVYVTSGQMMSEAGSDYDLVERRRVMDKACRQVYAAQLPLLNGDVGVAADGSPEGLEMFVALSEAPLATMVARGEISAGEVAVPPGQSILSDHTLRTRVRIVPRGKLSYIENEISYRNPALEATND